MALNEKKRKPHKRSRKGCARCKGRHVRCDEVVPICGNCFKYGHDCSLSKGRPLEIDIMPPDDFAIPKPEKQEFPSARTTQRYQTQQTQHQQAQVSDQGQYQQPSPTTQQLEYAQFSQHAQQVQYSQYSQCQGYESSFVHAVPYYDTLPSDLSPEAVSALNCYLQFSSSAPNPAF